MTDFTFPHDAKAGQVGTHSAYFNGCRCTPCSEAGARHRLEGNHEAYEAGRTRKPPLFIKGDRTVAFDSTDPRHGTMTGYTTGCRCPKCYQAGVDYRAARKVANA
ncbi:hypothetical protein PBI_COLTRANE_48 [Microbacterium phage Coltrane]|uniref:Uncharacterized protein n=4 Tax=Armstrongvirus armstrong TaxID=2734217 RepID=A0A3G2KDQ6_9CAUD|nr:hypothetical protein PBI_BRAHMS_48 [Microbacterium phage Brahms]AYN57025.1 hypothetical protein PBI_BERNSTEIN_48 [Microbacterium phage Bernstein]AYN57384.1 hypothetical protein PBI_COLTRANE_48 [Microbacterium phage Coltrane]AYN58972.1 hypothetical protein PBI_ROLLINS_48 [Microbacterium phage Rollins]